MEQSLIAIAGIHLSFLPWALGAMHVGSQVVSLIFSVAVMILACLPRRNFAHYSQDGLPYSPWRRLRGFPVFWLGLALVLYVCVQALNPAWRYERDDLNWWMQPLPHFSWLPTGANAPFALSNPWHAAMNFNAAWLLACGLWVGLTRRSSLRTLLGILAINASVLAFAGILQRISGNGKILWFIQPSTDYYVATFLYKNHAGAYFNLLLAATISLAAWHHFRAERKGERSNPAPLFVVCAIPVALIVVLSWSRASLVLLAVYIGVIGLLLAIHLMRQGRRGLVSSGVLACVLFIVIGGGIRWLGLDEAAGRFQRLSERDRLSAIDARQAAAQATWEMAGDRLLTGWGAGTYRYFFPLYQRHHPQIHHYPWEPGKVWYWEHAHNDYLEYLAELGISGVVWPAAILLWGMMALARARAWQKPAPACLALGFVLLLVHCWVDFNLQCPAILVTTGALGVILVRMASPEKSRSSQSTQASG